MFLKMDPQAFNKTILHQGPSLTCNPLTEDRRNSSLMGTLQCIFLLEVSEKRRSSTRNFYMSWLAIIAISTF